MSWFTSWPLAFLLAAFLAAAVAIAVFGTRLSGLADDLADRTGWGEAFVGALLLGAATSLPGLSASLTAAWNGDASLALGNCFGGIAIQTLFLAIADFLYPRANLEHASASHGNLLACTLLMGLLGLILFAALGPDLSVFGIHPVSAVVLGAYWFGLRQMRRNTGKPPWIPHMTTETRPDEPQPRPAEDRRSLTRLVGVALACALITGAAGWLVSSTAGIISARLELSGALMGGILVPGTTSLPELVTTIASVRRGALVLAVGGIIGGNAFDVLFAVASDAAYREGSIYHSIAGTDLMTVVLALVMSAILLFGLLTRERRGPANIGFESVALIVAYLGGMGVILFLA